MEASQFVVDLANSEGYKGKHATDLFIPAFQFNLLGDTSTVKQYERSVDFTSGEVIVNWEDIMVFSPVNYLFQDLIILLF